MTGHVDKEEARSRIEELVEKFTNNKTDYISTAYNETQARTEFISPLLQALGWDVGNKRRQPLGLREVIEEATVEVGEERSSKKPDYELRLARQRKLFIEAKKPSVNITSDRHSAFQIRRYGYSAGLPVCVLTNFRQLVVYDCLPIPAEEDEAHVARLKLLNCDQFLTNFDYLWDTLSRDAVYSGKFDHTFAVNSPEATDIQKTRVYSVKSGRTPVTDTTWHDTKQFDSFFLQQVRRWRSLLADDIYKNTPNITAENLTYAVQLFLCRIVFLRICEDRGIEKYNMLKHLGDGDTFNALMREIRRADDFYNSGIFHLMDDEGMGIRINNNTLRIIIAELYYPKSPYTFSVIETEVLGRVYEQFLGEEINIEENAIKIDEKPEISESGGVVPTPQYIVDSIVDRAMAPALSNKILSDLENFTVADICCGSGPFLLSAYEGLLEYYLSLYLADIPNYVGKTIYETAGNQWKLTFQERRRILLAHVRGVDIDSNAADVARLSLLLKLIEGETEESLRDYVDVHREPALPMLDKIVRSGNSLVDRREWERVMGYMSKDLAYKINPFDWTAEFPDEMNRGGFDVVVGNPPYVRIQKIAKYFPDEVRFFRSKESPYSTASHGNFDKYALFLERALCLLGPHGRLGFIVPHKFMTNAYGQTLRHLISSGQNLEEIVHFGVQPVFPEKANYTCIMVFDKRGRKHVKFERPGPLERWRYGQAGTRIKIPTDDLGEGPWQFATPATHVLFERIRQSFPTKLNELAEIFVGIQTSADPVYIFTPTAEDGETATMTWNGKEWPIERGILRPLLHKPRSNSQAYARPEANACIIFPYELVPTRDGSRARLIQPNQMASKFPVCWKYLNARRTELENRKISGGRAGERQWYQFGRSQSLTKFHGPKIVLTVLSREAPCAYDDADLVVTGGGNGPYYAIRSRPGEPISEHYLMAVLNHPLSEAMVKATASVFRGDYRSHGKQFIECLPIPIPSKSELSSVESAVAELIDALGESRSIHTPATRTIEKRHAGILRHRIEGYVSRIFGINEQEMDAVREFLDQ